MDRSIVKDTDKRQLLRSSQRGSVNGVQSKLDYLTSTSNVTRASTIMNCISEQDGNTMLHMAAQLGHINILEQILDNRVWANTPAHRLTFVNMKNKTHDTAIHVAAKYGQHAFIAKLVRLGAELDGLNAAHRTPLLVAIASTHHCARVDRPDYIETIRFLVSHRAHLGTLSAIGDTPLHFAVRQGDAQVAHLLLAAGADISARYGVDAPLHVAARMGNLAMVQLLLFTSRRGRPGAAAANPNAFNSAGDAVLHVAMRADHTAFVANIVEVLLQAGADASVRNSNGLNAWELALVKGLQEVHALFLNRGAG